VVIEDRVEDGSASTSIEDIEICEQGSEEAAVQT